MEKIDAQTTEIKVGNITFQVVSHFKEQGCESIDQTLARIICHDSENLIAMPNS